MQRWSIFLIAVITGILLVIMVSFYKQNDIKTGLLRLNSSNNTNNATHEYDTQQKSGDTVVRIARWSGGYTKGIENAILKYNKVNKDNIRIEILKIPQYRYNDIINMLMASGEGPEVFEITSNMIFTYIWRNWILDLSKYIDSSFFSRFPTWTIKYAKDPEYRGKFYTIPSTEITVRLIYNKDLFKRAGLDPDAPPKTFEELKNYAIKISESGKGDRKYGFALPAGEEWAGFVQSMEIPCTYSGVYYYDFKEGKYDLTVYESWFETINAIKKEGGLFPGEATMNGDIARAQFAEGNIGMMYATSWDPSILENRFSIKCDWGVAMPPAMDETCIGEGAVAIYPGGCYVVNSTASNIDKAIKVWEFLYSEECLAELYKAGSDLPVIKEILNNPAYRPSIANFDKFQPTNKDCPYPVTPKCVNDWERMKTYTQIMDSFEMIYDTLVACSEQMNFRLERAAISQIIDMNDYRYNNFDPLYPLEK